MTLPTLVVLLDDGTGAFPYDISKYAMFDDGFTFSRGRADWQGVVTGSQQSLKLNNSDGRFTAGSTKIASPSPIRVDQRIRIRETINGTTVTRGTWYVKSWPVDWPATVATIAMSTITTTDAQARAERHPMQVAMAEEIRADNPQFYWPLDDVAGSFAATDKSGNGGPALSLTGTGAAPVFGAAVPPGAEDSTGVTFSAGQALFAQGLGATGLGTECLIISFSTANTSAQGLAQWTVIGSSGILSLTAAGALMTSNHTVTIGTKPYNDGQRHTVGFRWTSVITADVYVDGVLTNTGVSCNPPDQIRIGMDEALGFTGTVAHVAYWSVAPSAARMVSITGVWQASELTSARVSRLAYYANMPTGTIDAGLTTVPPQDDFGSSVWDAVQVDADAEGGIAYINASGGLDFHNRARVPSKTSPDLTLAADFITPDVTPVVDDQQIINYFEATSIVTGATQVARNVVSELGNGTATNPGHGRYSDSKSYLVSTDQEAIDRANWIVSKFAEPSARYGTLTINLFKMTPAMAAAVLAVFDLDIWLRVTMMASQNPDGAIADVVIEGFTETCKANEWTLACNVVSMSVFRALIIDDPVYGAVDFYPVFY